MNKKTILVVVLLFFVIGIYFLTKSPEVPKSIEVPKFTKLEVKIPQLIKKEVLAAAKKYGHKYAFLYFSAPGCGPCKKLSKDYETKVTFREEIKRLDVEFFKINVTKEKYKEISKKVFFVDRWPSFLLFRLDKFEYMSDALNRSSGYGGVERFLHQLKKGLNQLTTIGEAEKRYAKKGWWIDALRLYEYYENFNHPNTRYYLFRLLVTFEFQDIQIRGRQLYPDFKAGKDINADYDSVFTDLKDFLISKKEPYIGSWSPINIARSLIQTAKKLKKDTRFLNAYIEKKSKAMLDSGDYNDNSDHLKYIIKSSKINTLLSSGKSGEAFELYLSQKLFPKGLKKAGDFNRAAWWIFENRVHMSKALLKKGLALALKGIDLAEKEKLSDASKARIVDTAANLNEALGDYSEALALFQKAIKLNPKEKEYSQAVERLQNTLK